MRYLSVCSGIEAASVAWRPLGWQPVAFSEIDPFPCAVLKHHYPSVPNWGDMTRFHEWPNATFDVLVGGTPCQSFSVAGLRAGLADPRGNLALTYLAIAGRYRPRWLVWENVPGILSADSHEAPDLCLPPDHLDEGAEWVGEDEYDADEDHAFACFLAGLSELGYGFAYRTLDAQYFGLAQRRARVFVVGHLGDWRRAAAVLFERASLSGHPPPRREAGEGVAAGTLRSTDGGINCDHGAAGHVVPVLSGTLNSSIGRGTGGAHETDFLLTHSLRADGFDASEDGTGRGTPIVPIDLRQASRGETLTNNRAHGSGGAPGHGVGNAGDPAFTVSERGQAIAFAENQRGELVTSDTMGALKVGGGKPGQGYPAVAFDARQSDVLQYGDKAGPLDTDGHSIGVAFQARGSNVSTGDVAGTFGSNADRASGSAPMMQRGMQVRRLTPRECERLQGFPDDYTLIPYRGKPAADGPRYKALGNSMAVPCMRWIGQRIQLVEHLVPDAGTVGC